MPVFIDAEQGTEAWFEARRGHATASEFWKILAGGKTRDTYLWDIVGERLSGECKRQNGSKSMEWGHLAEPKAREEYVFQTMQEIQLVGFAVHSRTKWVGASSDGLVGAKGSMEIKSPFNSGIHAHTLRYGMPEHHEPQVQGNLWILEREWIDFCSYDPAFESPYNLHIQRFYRKDAYINHLEREVKKFLAEVNCEIANIKKLKGKAA